MLAEENSASKKRIREAETCCASGLPHYQARLPTLRVVVNGKVATALVDSGCSRSIVSDRFVQSTGICTSPTKESIMMMSGATSDCKATAVIGLGMTNCQSPCVVDCLVLPIVPGIDLLLGMDCVRALGGMCMVV